MLLVGKMERKHFLFSDYVSTIPLHQQPLNCPVPPHHPVAVGAPFYSCSRFPAVSVSSSSAPLEMRKFAFSRARSPARPPARPAVTPPAHVSLVRVEGDLFVPLASSHHRPSHSPPGRHCTAVQTSGVRTGRRGIRVRMGGRWSTVDGRRSS